MARPKKESAKATVKKKTKEFAQAITGSSDLSIENQIFIIRGTQVMIERDLAELYGVEVKRMNEQVRRNIERFPVEFRFQLTEHELNKLVANCDRFMNLKHSYVYPYAFTEPGIAMLSTVLRSETAVKTSILIMKAFAAMRKIMSTYGGLIQRMDSIERKQVETDQKIEKVFRALEAHHEPPKEGVFFDGQVFDAYVLATRIVKSAKNSITLIDNYIDESVLMLLSKKAPGVKVTLLTANVSNQLALDVSRANAQYPVFELKEFTQSHDRFMIIDDLDVYHLGASLKDLGKKWFAFAKIHRDSAAAILEKTVRS